MAKDEVVLPKLKKELKDLLVKIKNLAKFLNSDAEEARDALLHTQWHAMVIYGDVLVARIYALEEKIAANKTAVKPAKKAAVKPAKKTGKPLKKDEKTTEKTINSCNKVKEKGM